MSVKLSDVDIVIFDLGDVIINIDPTNTFSKLQKLLNIENSVEGAQYENLEKGVYTESEYFNYLASNFESFNQKEFVEIWLGMLLDIPPHRIKLLQKIKETHQVFVLSNTNSIHIKEIEMTLKNQFNSSFEMLFDKIFFTYEMKMRKPDLEIYLEVKKHIPSDKKAIFLDDNIDNVNSSIEAGIPAVLVDKDISEIIEC